MLELKKLLQVLMQDPKFVDEILCTNDGKSCIVDFRDGSKYRNHPLFSDSTNFSIAIQLFYDGMGTTNPLRGKSVLSNMGVFYYTIKNLHPRFNSQCANVQLLTLCYEHDLKVYGFEPILDKFIAEINHLSSDGFDISIPGKNLTKVYASLYQVTCDNLALNGIFGFIECFSSDYFCTLCYATRDDIQRKFREEEFVSCTVAKYCADLNATKQKPGHCHGVKHSCELNDIPGFHILDNWSLDIMHIVLEGIIPFELGCILNALSNVVKLTEINQQLLLFWGKITVDKSCKPTELSKLEVPGSGISPSMTAMKLWALLRYLPLVIGEQVPRDNPHWKFLLHFSHLVDIIFSPKFTLGMINYMRDVIADHLKLFVDLYCQDGVIKLRPKHHLLVHLPSVVLKSGPLVGMSCLRYELKNSFFKRSAHIVCNFINICKTLAHRHQQLFLHSCLNKSHVNDSIVVGQYNIVALCTVPYAYVVSEKFSIQVTDEVAVTCKISVASIEYKCSDFVIVDTDKECGDLIFAKVLSFVSNNENSWFFVVEMWHTLGFDAHFHSFEVTEIQPRVYHVFDWCELTDYHALYCHKLSNSNRHFIRVPYHIF
jgi:hypothetical protein